MGLYVSRSHKALSCFPPSFTDGDIESLSGQSTFLLQIALETEDEIPGVQGCIGLVSSNPQQKLLAKLDPQTGLSL